MYCRWGLRTQWNVALVSEEEFSIRDKVRKVSKRASETCEQTLHRQEQNRTHMISINTYHLACAEGSALQCCMFIVASIASQLCVKQLMLARIEILWNGCVIEVCFNSAVWNIPTAIFMCRNIICGYSKYLLPCSNVSCDWSALSAFSANLMLFEKFPNRR